MARFGRYSSGNYLKGATDAVFRGIGAIQRKKERELGQESINVRKGHLKLAQEKHKAGLEDIPVPERKFGENDSFLWHQYTAF